MASGVEQGKEFVQDLTNTLRPCFVKPELLWFFLILCLHLIYFLESH